MEIVLTHYGSGKKTIVNPDYVEDYHTVFDRERGQQNTKITFDSGRLMNVEESVEEIHQILSEVRSGGVQKVNWNEVQSRMEKSYNRQYQQRQYTPERNFNRVDTFNEGL